jgi:hypothetical protein
MSSEKKTRRSKKIFEKKKKGFWGRLKIEKKEEM